MIELPPLREIARYDYFDQSEVFDDMLEFSFDYFYNGSRQGPKSDIIELSVVTWVMDFEENLFIRFCRYSGSKYTWKEKITEQMKIMMRDVSISEGFIRRRLVDFEVGKDKYFERDKFEKKFLELISRRLGDISFPYLRVIVNNSSSYLLEYLKVGDFAQ